MPMKTVEDVKKFWNVEACGTQLVDAPPNTADFFANYRKLRYSSEWHLPTIVPFQEMKNKRVLEIGCGNGADGTMFAQHGAIYTGVDLTKAAVDATSQHFHFLGLKGKFQCENAEKLSFPDNNFDCVYSHGVLHHTAHLSTAIQEVRRVLVPNGRAIIMLYHRHSFNYYVRIMGYMRLRLLFIVLSRFFRWQKDKDLLDAQLSGIRGNLNPKIWDVHYHNFLKEGWSYFSAKSFVHHATDGPECPFAFVFSRSEIKKIFFDFNINSIKIAHFPISSRKGLRWFPKAIESWLASIMGWYLFVDATKPAR